MKLDKSTHSVEAMFNNIASHYDFLNHFLSLGIDKIWRRKLIRQLVAQNPKLVLDVATGTSDLSIMLAKKNRQTKIVGVDIAEQMLRIGQKKIEKAQVSNRVQLTKASALNLPFESSTFDAAMVAFGVRNFEDLQRGINEIFRTISADGQLLVLEFSKPTKFPIKNLYNFYFKHFLPLVGGLISGDAGAYRYLPESVGCFPQSMQFIEILQNAGFVHCSQQRLSFGIATLYRGVKPLQG